MHPEAADAEPQSPTPGTTPGPTPRTTPETSDADGPAAGGPAPDDLRADVLVVDGGEGPTDGSEDDAPGKGATSDDEPTGSARDRFLIALLGARRLALGSTPRDRLWGWLGPAIVALLAAAVRFYHLAHPHELVFDETYYVKDAWSLLGLGYEGQWPDNPNPAFEAGDVNSYLAEPSYVVHPQLGKWMIAGGMAIGGAQDSFWWRFSTAVIGVVAVFLVARVARRMFASTALGIVAGLLLAIDGQAIVHSRTSLLDNFVMFWVLVGFWCILRDRDQSRSRLAEKAGAIVDAGGVIGRYGPRIGWRWWRFAAAVSFGLACGVKWSGLYFLAAFALLSVLWDATARRRIGVKRWWEDAFVVDAVPAALIMLPTAALTYLASWFSWFRADNSYMRHWAEQNPGGGVQWLPPALRSFWEYHVTMWDFHTGLVSDHPYKSSPWGWLLQVRPTSFYYESFDNGTGTCGSNRCVEAVLALGNPILWWLASAAAIAAIVLLIVRKDWRATAVLTGIAAGWLPWLFVGDRTIFTFYTIVFTPFVVLTLVYVMAVALESSERRPAVHAWVRTGIGVVLVVIVGASVYFYPIWAGIQISYDSWHQHMWFNHWI